MASSSGLLLAAATLVIVANAAKVPSGWKTCKRSLPPAEYDPCIYSAVKSAVSELLAKGAPSLSIPPLSPLKIPSIVIGQGSGPVAVDLKTTDVELHNLESFDLSKIRSSEVDNYKLGADVFLKKPLIWKSKYELSGKVLVLPIKGKGDCRFQLDNLRVSLNLTGTPYKKGGGETYMNVTEWLFDFETDKLTLHFENLFDGNKELGDNMNVFLNENWDEILKELKPAFVQALGLAFKGIASQIFHRVPYNKLLPE